MSNYGRKALLAGAATMFLLPAVSYAQSADTPPDKTFSGDIVVTARRVSESAQSVPVSITALSAETLKNKTVVGLRDVGALSPGLSFATGNGDSFTLNVAIRGQSEVESQIAVDPAVGVYVDDIYEGRSQTLGISQFDLASIQVLKGPQGTLFGRNNVGGSLLITTADPAEEFEGYVKYTRGNYDLSNEQAAISLPLSDTFRMRVALNKFDRVGNAKNLTVGGTQGDQDVFNARVKTIWEPTDSLTVRVNYDHTDAHGTPPAQIPTAVGPCDPTIGTGFQAFLNPRCAPVFGFNIFNTLEALQPGITAQYLAQNAQQQGNNYITYGDFKGYNKVDENGASLNVAYELGNVTLKSITGWRKIDFESNFDIEGSAAPLFSNRAPKKQRQISQEFQILGTSFDNALQWQGGLYYFDEKGSDGNDQKLGGFPAGYLLYDATNKSYAAYGQVIYSVPQIESLNITLGARATHDKREAVALHTTPTGCGLDPALLAVYGTGACEATREKGFNGTSTLVGIDYRVVPNVMVYATRKTGFRSGAFNARASTLDTFIAVPPETSWDYELGFKSDWNLPADARFRLNGAIFHTIVHNRQRSFFRLTSSGTLTTDLQSVTKGDIDGGELNAALQFANGLSLNAGWSYAQAKNKLFIDSFGVDRSNDPVPQNPVNAYNFGLEYKRDLADRGEFIFSADYRWLDDQFFGYDPSPNVTAPSYEQVNARIGWNNIYNSGVDAALWGKNLTDEEPMIGAILGDGNYGSSGRVFGDPRTYGVDLTYRF